MATGERRRKTILENLPKGSRDSCFLLLRNLYHIDVFFIVSLPLHYRIHTCNKLLYLTINNSESYHNTTNYW